MEFLNLQFYNNSLWMWLAALGLAILTYVGVRVSIRLFSKYFRVLARKTHAHWDDMVVAALGHTKSIFILILSLVVGGQTLSLPKESVALLHTVFVFSLLIQAALWLHSSMNFFLQRIVRKKGEGDRSTVTTVHALGLVGKCLLWTALVLLLLENAKVNITALVTGLGIGGIAIALAVQNVLGDLLAALSIMLDKPFVVGDFIVVGELAGTVEHIGLKTTRLRSLSGELLVLSNSDLLKSRIHNYQHMSERRILFSVGVVYSTSQDSLAQIPAIIKEVVSAQSSARFDRAHFKNFGDSSLNFEIVYYVLSPDYNVYMDTQQAINLGLNQRFTQLDIEFAFPTRTIVMQK